jgi:hypothetical protein
MKIASKLLAGFLFAGFSAINAYADQFCSLSVSSSVIQPGRFFSFTVNAQPGRIFPGPLDPGLGTYRVIFYGTKDGIADIPASGWEYPGKTATYGSTVLSGFQNPGTEEIAGTYTRYAALVTALGTTYCVTNATTTTLLSENDFR